MGVVVPQQVVAKLSSQALTFTSDEGHQPGLVLGGDLKERLLHKQETIYRMTIQEAKNKLVNWFGVGGTL